MSLLSNQISLKRVVKVIGIFLFLSFSGCVMAVFRKMFFEDTGYNFLIWNLFLAWIPVILSMLIYYIYAFHKRSSLKTIFMMFLIVIWAVFYPNSQYMITDYIHLRGLQYYFTNFSYNMNFIIWYDFIMISLFALTGFFLGFLSLYMLQIIIAERYNKFIGWILSVAILFFSSFGIYLGRFNRWNSWDIISKPMILINSILENTRHYAVEFTISFGLFLTLMYIVLYNLTKLNEYNADSAGKSKDKIIKK